MAANKRKRTHSSESEDGDFAGDFDAFVPDDALPNLGEADEEFSSAAYTLEYQKHLSKVYKNLARNDVYFLNLNDAWLRTLPVLDVIGVYNSIFRDMMKRMLPNLPSNASMRIIISTPLMGSHDVIHVPLTDISEMSADIITDVLQKVIQSAKFEGITSRQLTTIEIGVYIPPSGNGKKIGVYQLQNNEFDSRRLKKSILRVDTETLCMAKSIYVANCRRLDGCVRARNLVKSTRNNTLTFNALYMHKKLKIPISQACVITDVQKFEEYLKVRICVVSSTIGNKFIYRGNKDYICNGTLYLYHAQKEGETIGHFDVITNIRGFLANNYFCEACLKGFNKVYEHRCDKYCSACFRQYCLSSDCKMSCRKCHITLKSEECFREHKKIRQHRGVQKKATSWCSKRWKCTKCFKTFTTTQKVNVKTHICFQKYCRYCKEYCDINHICFHRSYMPLKTHDNFLFLDYECDVVNTQNQCKDGYLCAENVSCEHCATLGDDVKCQKCSICLNCGRNNCSDIIHIPNYCVVQRTCSKCIYKPLNEGCVSCGMRCTKCRGKNKRGQYKHKPCSYKCRKREKVFSGENVTNNVGQYIVCEHHRGYIVIAHNMSRYDGSFLMEYVLENSIVPQNVIYKGTKCILWIVPKLNLKFVDSLSFLQMSLDKLPSTLGVSIESKKFFPIFFNQNIWRTYVGEFPAEKYFNIESMGVDKYTEFKKWYNDNKNTVFDLQKTLYEYCSHDVTILRTCIITFKQLVIDLTTSEVCNDKGDHILLKGMDPFANAITLPQLCQKIFRYLCLQEEVMVRLKDNDETVWTHAYRVKGHIFEKDLLIDGLPVLIGQHKIADVQFVRSKIGQLDHKGNITGVNHSRSSIECLTYYERHLQTTVDPNINVQHGMKSGGEMRLILQSGKTRYVDGYYEYLGQKHVIQFHGCFYHSCSNCYKHMRLTEKHPFYGLSHHDNYIRTISMDNELRNDGYLLTVFWECEFKAHITQNPHLEQFIHDLDITDRIIPRDALFGGRCEAFKLYSNAKLLPPGSFIDYYDFVSLYPSVMFGYAFPTYHYKVICHDFGPIETYFGIAKVRIRPPKNLYIPVLPLRINDKLVFTLCKTCAAQQSTDLCKCNDVARGWIATYATPEIIAACKLGYIVEAIYEVYHYAQTECYDPRDPASDSGLFTDYIKIFLREKTYASGFPDYCISDKMKMDFVHKYKDDYGIVLDPAKMIPNKGRRAVAKTFLNSLWGIYCMRSNPQITLIVGDLMVPQFLNLMTSSTKKVTNFHIVNKEILQVEYKHNDDFAPPSQNRHVILGLFVTMYARLKLNGILQNSAKEVLYCDMDSVIRENLGGTSLRTDSSLLGELANELSLNDSIEEFVSTGSKTYSYITSKNRSVVKAKGFYLDNKLHDKINLHSMLQMLHTHMSESGLAFPNVENKEDDTALSSISKIKISRKRIKKNKYTQKMYTTTERKTYSFVYTKRIMCANYTTLPFGWQKD